VAVGDVLLGDVYDQCVIDDVAAAVEGEGWRIMAGCEVTLR
jgi:hypothetical protein